MPRLRKNRGGNAPATWRILPRLPARRPLLLLTKFLTHLFGTGAEREVRRLFPLLEVTRALEPRMMAMTNDELRAQTGLFKERLAQGASLDDILPDAFAATRETAKRLIGMRPFDVQILGGIALHQGNIAEMVTGEGKTLVATMPVYLNALAGHGVHVVTVNDYLARRDMEWMRPVYEFLGLTVGLIQHDMSTAERQVGYRADITYGTNNEFGFDYLRDNMAVRPEQRVQRELHYAIVDEVDSILIDEARTPLIISGRPEKSSDVYIKVDDVVRRLRKEEDFTVDEKQRHILLTDEGMVACERMLGVENLYADDTIGLVHLLEQALKAHHFFKRDKEYMVQDQEVLIVDEFTGRVMEGRRYSDGLHQALEAKERVPLKFESQTIASITYQNYFRLYSKLAGMTGTAATEAAEFAKVYNLEVLQVPTNLPLIRADDTDLVFGTERGKFNYVINEIKRINEGGRPILVGTVSIEKSEQVAQLMDEAGVRDYQVLNAKHHEREASIVANAGKRGAITIATNMAGRGTDIKLAEGVRELGGLAIIGTERHESRRIDNQLRGRAGRQGDPGTTRFYVSLEDEVARLFGGDKVKRLLDLFGSQEMDDEPLSQRMVSRSIERAQRQVEEHNFEIRKHILEYDQVMDKQRKYIYAMRREVLEDRDVTQRLEEMYRNSIGDAVDQYAPQTELPENWDIEGLEAALYKLFKMEFDLSGSRDAQPQALEDSLFQQAVDEYHAREKSIVEEIEQRLRQDFLEAKEAGQIARGVDEDSIDFAASASKRARKFVHDLEMMALLRAVDDKWIDHLYEMDYLRESVRLRAFGQRDPLLEYKQEGFEMFQNMVKTIEEIVISTLFLLTDPEVRRKRAASQRLGTLTAKEDPFAQLQSYSYISADKQADRSFAAYDTTRFALAGQTGAPAASAEGAEAERPKKVPIRVEEKIGPNDPCPCGSGKKYKKCHGRLVD
ncbi:MAG: preprotein translocase subunit SecA [Candidatus Hydrogenedentes bacterium]|nr:preprotein translocase subunit SecA [Candidatus Hydrogenedentota bacterium]